MDQTHKKSFLIVFSLLFIFPIFFVPGGTIQLGVAKSFILSFGVALAVLVFLWEAWQEKMVNIPWHRFILVVILLPLVYFLSALSSTPSSLSLFGYNLEAGTFGFILIGSVLLLFVGTVFANTSRILKALLALFASFSLVAVFSAVKIISSIWTDQTGDFLVWGNFFGNVGNPIGMWTDLATSFGLLAVLSIVVLGMIPVKKFIRIILYFIFTLSTILLAAINFPTAFTFTLGASVILFVYFLTVEKRFSNLSQPFQVSTRLVLRPTLLPIILGAVSVLFLINPVISSERGTLSELVANTSGVINSEVRPSFSTTLSISRTALFQETWGAFLGSGPNTFSRDWLIYKPVEINTTPFWSVTFPFGVGFLPTQIISTGILGTILWLAFFIFLIFLGIKALSRIPESRALRFSVVSSFVALLYLWSASFMYAPSAVLLVLAFVFSGLFVAASRLISQTGYTGIVQSRAIIFSSSVTANFTSTLLIMVVAFGSLTFSYIALNKTIADFYFQKAASLSNIQSTSFEDIEMALEKAVKFFPSDIYYVAISRIHFIRAQAAAAATEGDQEENKAIFEDAISKSIMTARSAVSANPSSYQNWMVLGMVYSFLVQKPFSLSGAYENASFAFLEAEKRNPANPEVPLFLAQLELRYGKAETARSLIRQALILKEDYADAYLMLAQLEIQEDNIAKAIESAEKVALLLPGNAGIYFELGLLKYSNNDYSGAENAFKLALDFAPNYANAQYYLGLTLAQLGRLDDAQELFEVLAVSNPDNEDVKTILEEIKSGGTTFLYDTIR